MEYAILRVEPVETKKAAHIMCAAGLWGSRLVHFGARAREWRFWDCITIGSINLCVRTSRTQVYRWPARWGERQLRPKRLDLPRPITVGTREFCGSIRQCATAKAIGAGLLRSDSCTWSWAARVKQFYFDVEFMPAVSTPKTFL